MMNTIDRATAALAASTLPRPGTAAYTAWTPAADPGGRLALVNNGTTANGAPDAVPSDPQEAQMQRDAIVLESIIAKYHAKLDTELQSRASAAQALAHAGKDRRARKHADKQLDFATKRIEVLTSELYMFMKRLAEIKDALHAAHVARLHEQLAAATNATLTPQVIGSLMAARRATGVSAQAGSGDWSGAAPMPPPPVPGSPSPMGGTAPIAAAAAANSPTSPTSFTATGATAAPPGTTLQRMQSPPPTPTAATTADADELTRLRQRVRDLERANAHLSSVSGVPVPPAINPTPILRVASPVPIPSTPMDVYRLAQDLVPQQLPSSPIRAAYGNHLLLRSASPTLSHAHSAASSHTRSHTNTATDVRSTLTGGPGALSADPTPVYTNLYARIHGDAVTRRAVAHALRPDLAPLAAAAGDDGGAQYVELSWQLESKLTDVMYDLADATRAAMTLAALQVAMNQFPVTDPLGDFAHDCESLTSVLLTAMTLLGAERERLRLRRVPVRSADAEVQKTVAFVTSVAREAVASRTGAGGAGVVQLAPPAGLPIEQIEHMNKLEHALKKLLREKEALQAQLNQVAASAAVATAAADVDALHQQVAALEVEMEQWKAKAGESHLLVSVVETKAAQADDVAAQLREKVEKLEGELAGREDDEVVAQLRAKVEQLEAELVQVKAEAVARVEEVAEHAQETAARAVEDVDAESVVAHEDLEPVVAQLQARIEQLETYLAAAQAATADAAAATAPIDPPTPAVETADASIDATASDDLAQFRALASTLESRLAALEPELAAQFDRISSLEADLAAARADAQNWHDRAATAAAAAAEANDKLHTLEARPTASLRRQQEANLGARVAALEARELDLVMAQRRQGARFEQERKLWEARAVVAEHRAETLALELEEVKRRMQQLAVEKEVVTVADAAPEVDVMPPIATSAA
ncbi:hypothetical protein AMAG_04588 [Allomyces macrogynus ATCC 38327]|uniref:Uncharacterized protein n=1 Tax=Allomyces macrogynus (strain ATCC 38327) TaxID=578462 RepID=A0A0L0S5J8_ALLM3|nr:hypothetical protein AMAG_04588 [Allomyces macrogynus ATCC 38327]|eukprot:KNE57730.1 hypothetical protein AMAG_04588 [Allomyces macrogynus ATCC 38327]